MNIRDTLLTEHSRSQTERIANHVGSDKTRFRELMKCLLDGDHELSRRAAWAVNYCSMANPALVTPYIPRLISKLRDPSAHDAVRRNILRIFETSELPEDACGELYDICFGFLRSLEQPAAVKAFSMTVLCRICARYPELAPELRLTIEDMMPHGQAAIIARGKKILKALQKI